ncbi:MAG TPA: TolC family protein [Candidatus Polarisedimenticolaceae bacterium]|nr:TolC family protein [Candidatus Polarisedimenticolaceae bacterium]
MKLRGGVVGCGVRLALVAVALPSAVALAAERTPAEPALDLAALVAEAEAANPMLRAAAERRTGAQHGPAEAGALPDPTVSFSFQNESTDWTLGESPMSNLTFAWSQEMPWGGKRRLAGDVARGEVGLLAAEEADLRAEVRARVKAAYVDLLRVDRTLAILEENRRLLAALREVAQARYEAGDALLENVLRAGAEISRLDLDIAELSGERWMVEADLGALLGRVERARFGRAVELPAVVDWDPAELEAVAAESSTRLARAEAQIALEARRLAAARRETKADWSWRAGYAERGGLDSIWSGGIAFRLPLYAKNKQREAIVRSEHDVEAARQEAVDVEARVLGELRRLIVRVEVAELRRRTLEQAVMPQAQAAFDAARVAYESGQADFGTVFDAFDRTLEDARLLERVRAEHLGGLARLEPLVGRELVLTGDGEDRE